MIINEHVRIGRFRQWRLRTKRFEDIESAVLAYMDGEAPSGAPWVDVTDEFTDS